MAKKQIVSKSTNDTFVVKTASVVKVPWSTGYYLCAMRKGQTWTLVEDDAMAYPVDNARKRIKRSFYDTLDLT